MDAATRTDPIEAYNERSKASGWTITCGPAAGFRQPELAKALALWRTKANGRSMPMRADMTARVMKPFLRQMSIVERVGTPSRYRVRLHGSKLASYTGDKTGRFLEDVLPPGRAAGYAAVYDTMLELLVPLRLVIAYQAPKIDYLAGESLIAPLAAAGRTSPLILSVTFVDSRSNVFVS
jgi:hypothetical protein